jgi:hypothetical protein
MNSKELSGVNDVKIVINEAGWEDAKNLRNALWREASLGGIDLQALTQIKSLGQLKDFDIDLSKIIGAFMLIDSSPIVDRCIMKCLEKSLYNGEKITAKTFDASEAREDYYAIMVACITLNISPFIKGLVSAFNQLAEQVGETLE